MSLLGLSWLQMISIVTVLAGAVVMIYLLKLKRRGLLISSSLIWREVLRQNRAESLIERLRWWISLMLQIAFVGLIVAALAQPKLNSSGDGWTVVILDASASMLARSPGDLNRTRFQLAQNAASGLIHNLPGTESMMVVRLGATNDTLEPFTTEREKLQSAVDHAKPGEAPVDIDAALTLANQSLTGKIHPKIVLITDGGLSPDAVAKSSIKPELIQVGSAVDNVGITAFSVRQQYVDLPDYQLYFEISNFGKTDRSFDVKFYQNDDLLNTKPVTLRARSAIQQTFSDFSPKGGPIRVELDVDDAFPLDNKAYAYLPPRRSQRGLLVTNGNLFLESALSADPTVDLKKISPAQFDEKADYDVIVFDSVAPKYSGRANTLYLNPQGEFSPVATEGEIKQASVNYFDGQHPLLKYISFKDLSIKNVPRMKAGPGDVILARAGNDPIIVVHEHDARRSVVMAFDTKASDKADLPLRAAFPILIENVLHWFANEKMTETSTTPVGQSLQLEAKGSKASIKDPDGAIATISNDGSFLPVRTGYYEVKNGGDSQVVSVNLVSASESDLIPRDGLDRVTSKIDHEQGAWFVHPIWFYLALVGLLLASTEWFTYQRRVTV